MRKWLVVYNINITIIRLLKISCLQLLRLIRHYDIADRVVEKSLGKKSLGKKIIRSVQGKVRYSMLLSKS